MRVLSQVVDDNRRSALHFVAAIGSAKCCQLLIDAGADVNLQDREGYTPMHMAAGYMQTSAMQQLLEAGADPEIKDKTGRDCVTLVNNLRLQMPANPAVLQRRLALEQVANVLVDRLYDEADVASVLEERTTPSGEKEYLVQFRDESPDSWVSERDMAEDVLSDWQQGLETAAVATLLDMKEYGTEREFLVQWADGTWESWEPEEHVPPELIEELARERPDRFKQQGKKGGKSSRQRRKQAADVSGDGASTSGRSLEAVAAAGGAPSNGSSSSTSGKRSRNGRRKKGGKKAGAVENVVSNSSSSAEGSGSQLEAPLQQQHGEHSGEVHQPSVGSDTHSAAAASAEQSDSLVVKTDRQPAAVSKR